MLPRLRKYYRLAVINNGTALTYPYFKARLDMEETFDLFISSARVGVAKPDARIYQRACDGLGVVASECLYMDDVLENVIAAQRLGMQGIHWPEHARGFEQFTKYLREAGLTTELFSG
jgi:putative hydrolase of the HAD superfamily